MSDFPKVSIIITNYNYQEFLVHTIESCLAQTYKGEMEIIVVDDCSTDQSRIVLEKYKSFVTSIMLPRNSGYSVAKNEGIRASNGDFITTIDADDMLTRDSIAIRSEFLQLHPQYLLVYAQAYLIKGGGDIDYWERRLYKIDVSHREDKIHAQTVMVRRDVYKRYGLYDERLRSRADNEMWWRLRNVARVENQFFFMRHPVAFYRKHERNMIQYRKDHPEYANEVTRILEEQRTLRASQGITKENTKFLKG